MKTLTLFVSFLIAISNIQGQDYQISFTASGQSATIDSIHVTNLSQAITLKLDGNDVLHLVGTLGLNTLINDENSMKIYPNPMIESTFVEFKNQTPQTISIEVFNELSTLIVKKDVMVQNGLQRFEISGLNAGIYTLVVSSKDWLYSAKIISLGEKSKNATIKQQSVDLGSTHERVVESTNDLVQMQYNDGEIILFKSYAENYIRVLTLLPTQSQTVNFEFVPCSDDDGNNYAVVTLGIQTWMAENLKTTKYSDGTDIPLVIDNTAWENLSTPAYCWYDNDQAAYGNIYGAFYNWYAVETGTICPTGWHVPSSAEWNTLKSYLIANGYNYDGTTTGNKIAKAMANTSGWTSSTDPGDVGNDQVSNNRSGFTALPSGSRSDNGTFYSFGESSYWWSLTDQSGTHADYYRIGYSINFLYYGNKPMENGLSVRCLRD